MLLQPSLEISTPHSMVYLFFFKDFLFIHEKEKKRERVREREAETQAEGEAGSTWGAQRRTQSLGLQDHALGPKAALNC